MSATRNRVMAVLHELQLSGSVACNGHFAQMAARRAAVPSSIGFHIPSLR
jgi:hypothetical protein